MDLSDVFEHACKDEFGSCNTRNPCPDVFFAIIDLRGKKPHSFKLCSFREFSDSFLDEIDMVLESPHIAEYDANGNAIAPAQGRTGRNIEKLLIRHLNAVRLPKKRYKLRLIEAVSYQCSNGANLKQEAAKRDCVFKTVWQNGGEDDFKTRLQMYSPNVVINACTGGIKNINSGATLNSLVQQAINSLSSLQGKRLYYSVHPCCFHFRTCMARTYKR